MAQRIPACNSHVTRALYSSPAYFISVSMEGTLMLPLRIAFYARDTQAKLRSEKGSAFRVEREMEER
jgi:hypothetical protein